MTLCFYLLLSCLGQTDRALITSLVRKSSTLRKCCKLKGYVYPEIATEIREERCDKQVHTCSRMRKYALCFSTRRASMSRHESFTRFAISNNVTHIGVTRALYMSGNRLWWREQ